MKTYQFEYAAGRPQMYDKKSRVKKAERMLLLLKDYYGKEKLKQLHVLDLGASTGIIGEVLAKKVKRVVAIDIDKGAIVYAKKNFKRKNLHFQIDDAMKLSFKDNSFDVVICAHVYEHVPDAIQLFKEIYRVLRPNGVCYLAAINKYWIMEPHYDLPLLSWFPKKVSDYYVRIFKKSNEYYETPRSYWDLTKITSQFKKLDYTGKILSNPKKFGYSIPNNLSFLSLPLKLSSPFLRFTTPTFFWLLVKEK